MKRVALLLVLLTVTAGCMGPGSPPPTDDGSGNDTSWMPDDGDGNATAPLTLRVNGSRAWDLAHEQVHYPNGSVRYRIPGTPSNTEAAVLIHDRLEESGLDASFDHFNATYGCERTPMHNVVAVRPGVDPSRVIYVGAHYDTRPIAEKDDDPEAQDEPIPGANDGASGVGVLLALAEALQNRTVVPTVVFVFFDGEDGGGYKGWQGAARCTDWILGSRHYADQLTGEEVDRAEAMLLVDLVGDPDLRLPREGRSDATLQDEVYAIAGGLGYPQFTNETGIGVIDDHVPFLERGIPAVDLIHLRETSDSQPDPFPPTHHKQTDTMDRVSPDSLEAVGRVVEAWLLTR